MTARGATVGEFDLDYLGCELCHPGAWHVDYNLNQIKTWNCLIMVGLRGFLSNVCWYKIIPADRVNGMPRCWHWQTSLSEKPVVIPQIQNAPSISFSKKLATKVGCWLLTEKTEAIWKPFKGKWWSIEWYNHLIAISAMRRWRWAGCVILMLWHHDKTYR